MIKVLGVDPGLAETGLGIVTGSGLATDRYAFGFIETDKAWPVSERLNKIFEELQTVIRAESPDLLVVEQAFSLKEYPKSGIILGQVTGVVMLAASQNKIPIREVAVREAKKVLTGNGNASKQQLERSVRHILNHPEKIRPDHASDALALALIGVYRFHHDIRAVRKTNRT